MVKKLSGIEHIFVFLAEVAVGAALLTRPESFTAAIIAVIGAMFVLTGLTDLIAYFKNPPQIGAKTHGMAKGLTTISLGVFLALKARWFVSSFQLMTAFYGVLMLVSGFNKVQWTVDLMRCKYKYWFMALISAALSLLLAALLLRNPFSQAQSLWLFMGTMMIAEAALDGLAYYFRRKK